MKEIKRIPKNIKRVVKDIVEVVKKIGEEIVRIVEDVGHFIEDNWKAVLVVIIIIAIAYFTGGAGAAGASGASGSSAGIGANIAYAFTSIANIEASALWSMIVEGVISLGTDYLYNMAFEEFMMMIMAPGEAAMVEGFIRGLATEVDQVKEAVRLAQFNSVMDGSIFDKMAGGAMLGGIAAGGMLYTYSQKQDIDMCVTGQVEISKDYPLIQAPYSDKAGTGVFEGQFDLNMIKMITDGPSGMSSFSTGGGTIQYMTLNGKRLPYGKLGTGDLPDRDVLKNRR